VLKDPKAAPGQTRVVRVDSHQLAGKIAFDRQGDVPGASGIEAPASIRILASEDLRKRAPHPLRVTAVEQRVHVDVVRLEHRVGLKLAAPESFRILLGEKIIPRTGDGRFHPGQFGFLPADSRFCSLRCPLGGGHANRSPSGPGIACP